MFVPQIRAHAEAMTELADRLGADAPVPTCPDWTVGTVLTHLVRITGFFGACCRTPVSGPPPGFSTPPEYWPDVRARWDEQSAALVAHLAGHDLATLVWAPDGFAPELRSWARRAAHEFAIHRLDLEHAAAGSAAPDAVPPLYGQAFAADGVDELFSLLTPPVDATGTVLYWAEDAGTGWWLDLTAGAEPAVTRVTEHRPGATATVSGTADAVYRAAWHRPHQAAVTGAADVLAGIRTP